MFRGGIEQNLEVLATLLNAGLADPVPKRGNEHGGNGGDKGSFIFHQSFDQGINTIPAATNVRRPAPNLPVTTYEGEPLDMVWPPTLCPPKDNQRALSPVQGCVLIGNTIHYTDGETRVLSQQAADVLRSKVRNGVEELMNNYAKDAFDRFTDFFRLSEDGFGLRPNFDVIDQIKKNLNSNNYNIFNNNNNNNNDNNNNNNNNNNNYNNDNSNNYNNNNKNKNNNNYNNNNNSSYNKNNDNNNNNNNNNSNNYNNNNNNFNDNNNNFNNNKNNYNNNNNYNSRYDNTNYGRNFNINNGR